MLPGLLLTGIECGHEDGSVNIEGGMPPTVRGIQYLHGEEHRITCTIVVSHLKGTAIVYKPHVLRRCLSSQGTSMYPIGYMRVAGQLWLLLKTVKQLAGTIKATMAQVISIMGF